MNYKYNLVGCGGTFDQLHFGHKSFLNFAFSLAKNVLIGITSDKYILQNKSGRKILPLSQRMKVLKVFLKEMKYAKRSRIVILDDAFGPAAWENIPIEALIITRDTLFNAQNINKQRINLGLKSLNLIFAPLVTTANVPLSSSRVRNKTMNVYGDLFLPQTFRDTLKRPLGVIEKDISKIRSLRSEKIATIGDVTTKIFNTAGIGQRFSVVDFLINRKKTYQYLSELSFDGSEQIYSVKNPAGQISYSLWNTIKTIIENKALSKRIIIRIEGEEDLAVIPFVLLLPKGYHIFYGQPNTGLIHIKNTLKIQLKFQEIISNFTQGITRGS